MKLFSGVKQNLWSWDYSQGLDYQDLWIIRHRVKGILLYVQINTSGYSTTTESWQHQPLMHCAEVMSAPPTWGSGWGISMNAFVPAIPFFPQDIHTKWFCPACHGHSPLPWIQQRITVYLRPTWSV